jgi:hypothetical protein
LDEPGTKKKSRLKPSPLNGSKFWRELPVPFIIQHTKTIKLIRPKPCVGHDTTRPKLSCLRGCFVEKKGSKRPRPIKRQGALRPAPSTVNGLEH